MSSSIVNSYIVKRIEKRIARVAAITVIEPLLCLPSCRTGGARLVDRVRLWRLAVMLPAFGRPAGKMGQRAAATGGAISMPPGGGSGAPHRYWWALGGASVIQSTGTDTHTRYTQYTRYNHPMHTHSVCSWVVRLPPTEHVIHQPSSEIRPYPTAADRS